MMGVVRSCCVACVVLLSAAALWAADGQERPELGGIVDLPHLADPPLVQPEAELTLDPRLEVLWLAALRQDDPGTRIEALHAFREGHRRTGYTFSEQAATAIVGQLDASQPGPVRLAAAGTAFELDLRAATDALMELERQPPHTYHTPPIDRILAAWDHQPARELWRARVEDRTAPYAVRRSAIEALGAVGDDAARPLLLKLAQDASEPADLRLTAARALGSYVTTGLAPDATTLSARDTTGAQVAAAMLTSHEEDAALQLLAQLTGHSDDTVAAEAARQLADRAPDRLDLALATHDDPEVRYAATRAATTAPSVQTVEVLAGRLDDPSVKVRKLARNTLIAWSNERSDLRDAVIPAIERTWTDATWRGREQAALIAGWIDHDPMASTLAEALDDERPEVRLAVTGALRLLQVTETGPAMQARLATLLEIGASPPEGFSLPDFDGESTQLLLALGTMNRREAEPLFRKIVPKGSVPYTEGRGAAVYVLGKWYEGVGESALAAQLTARMLDASVTDPEMVSVQRFAAIALGRLGANDRLEDLRYVAASEQTPGGPMVRLAAMWAIEKLTGEHLELPESPPSRLQGWFLEPAK